MLVPMFETTQRCARTLHLIAVATAVAWLAWVCFTQLPFVAALILFPLGVIAAAVALGPVAAGAAFIAGALIAATATLLRKARAARRHAA